MFDLKENYKNHFQLWGRPEYYLHIFYFILFYKFCNIFVWQKFLDPFTIEYYREKDIVVPKASYYLYTCRYVVKKYDALKIKMTQRINVLIIKSHTYG